MNNENEPSIAPPQQEPEMSCNKKDCGFKSSDMRALAIHMISEHKFDLEEILAEVFKIQVGNMRLAIGVQNTFKQVIRDLNAINQKTEQALMMINELKLFSSGKGFNPRGPRLV